LHFVLAMWADYFKYCWTRLWANSNLYASVLHTNTASTWQPTEQIV